MPNAAGALVEVSAAAPGVLGCAAGDGAPAAGGAPGCAPAAGAVGVDVADEPPSTVKVNEPCEGCPSAAAVLQLTV